MAPPAPDRWLLLRGLTREARHWHTFPTRFSQALGGAGVATLDLPGAGTEHLRQSPVTISAIAADVRRRWLDIAAGHRWGLVTISLGGMVGLEWTRRYPMDFSHHAIINSSARNLGSFSERLRPRSYRNVARLFLARDTKSREVWLLRTTTALLGDNLDSMAEVQAGFARERPMSRGNVLRQAVAALGFVAPRYLSCRTLVLSGLQDGLVHPACSDHLARHLRAEHLTHESGGHDLTTDDPQWCADVIAGWVGRATPGAAA